MRLKSKEIQRLARRIVNHLDSQKLFLAKKKIEFLENRAIELLQKNMEEEDAIDAEAKSMLDKFDAQIQNGEVDPRKMFMMIKKELAKKKNFVI